MTWTIKQMSKQSGIPLDSLRYYDKLGIVSPKRKGNNYRYYDEKDYIYLQYVMVMKYAQFSLSEIKTIIQSFGKVPDDECNRINRELLEGKRTELLEIAKNYRKIARLIDAIIPMIGSKESFSENEEKVDQFIHSVYRNISKM